MKIKGNNDRYRKMIDILRNSSPALIESEEFENEVIRKIQHADQKRDGISDLIESLFGWVYIGWVRRSLIGIAVALIAVFVYQQAFIFRQVKNISKQIVITGNESSAVSSSVLDKRLTLYKMSARLSPAGEIRISERQLEELLESYNDLQVKYKDLLRIIEEDPGLKSYIENKLKEEKKYKPDI